MTHVRLPVGYWAFDVSGGEPFIQGQLPYVQKALDWARVVGLKVIIDLHGAPGSQNGFDNSGQLKRSGPEWHLNPTNVERTNAIVKTLAETFSGDSDVVAAIAPLNEQVFQFFWGQYRAKYPIDPLVSLEKPFST